MIGLHSDSEATSCYFFHCAIEQMEAVLRSEGDLHSVRKTTRNILAVPKSAVNAVRRQL